MCALCNGAEYSGIQLGGCVSEGTAYINTCDDGILDHIYFLQCQFLGEAPVCDIGSGNT